MFVVCALAAIDFHTLNVTPKRAFSTCLVNDNASTLKIPFDFSFQIDVKSTVVLFSADGKRNEIDKRKRNDNNIFKE